MIDEFDHIHRASPYRLAEMLENHATEPFSREFRELLTESASRLRSLMSASKHDAAAEGLPPVSEIYCRRIEDCDFSVRLLNILKSFEIETVGELMEYDLRSFLKARNCGKHSMAELRDFAYVNGITFGDKDITRR